MPAARLHRRMVLGQFKDLAEYTAHLDNHPLELAALDQRF